MKAGYDATWFDAPNQPSSQTKPRGLRGTVTRVKQSKDRAAPVNSKNVPQRTLLAALKGIKLRDLQ